MTPLPLGRFPVPFNDRDFVFELKVDGFRCVAHLDRDRVHLVSRNGHHFRRFDALARELAAALPVRAVLDGEVVALDREGRPHFNALFWSRARPYFYAFDVLTLDGEDVRGWPLLERKRLLKRLVGCQRGAVRYLDHVNGRAGVDLFRIVCERDLEGVVAKLARSAYRTAGEWSPWLKIKNRDYSQARDRHELVRARASRVR